MKVNPNDPAYPMSTTNDGIKWDVRPGMTIRLKIASEQLTGEPLRNPTATDDNLSLWALTRADALIEAYNDSQAKEVKDEGDSDGQSPDNAVPV